MPKDVANGRDAIPEREQAVSRCSPLWIHLFPQKCVLSASYGAGTIVGCRYILVNMTNNRCHNSEWEADIKEISVAKEIWNYNL